MTALIPFILFCQVFGAFVGTCTAVWGEIAYIRAMRDGHIDIAERAHMLIIARGLRFGMTLLLLASFALVVVNYFLHSVPQPALSSSFWIFILSALLIIGVSWARSHQRISFALGSAIIFTTWWFLAFLTIGKLSTLSFGAAVAFLVLATAIFYAVLHYSRFIILRSK